MRKVLIIDTSILCVWLEVPSKKTSGSKNDVWDKARIDKKLADEEQQGTTFIFPLASLIETGNHIAQAGCYNRYELAQKLSDILLKALDGQTPWGAFSNLLCEENNLRRLAKEWPNLATQKIAIGDATIKHVAEYYDSMSYSVEILTGDKGLKAYEPASSSKEIPIPRRHKNKSR
ncbi:hypothetical protein [Candidatus Albibeggiatoa sp. nov. BB20]|uniref:hypothetical protein n=1 Tax=Candidatus Albibeggiatoa sp. nov. BB20 TaxID=3162723 RepID=UPI003365A612